MLVERFDGTPTPNERLRWRVSETGAALHDWVRDLRSGATSRSELIESCLDVPEEGFGPQFPPQTGSEEIAFVRDEDRMLAELCRDIRNAPEARTLREWADLIEERLGPAHEYGDPIDDLDFAD